MIIDSEKSGEFQNSRPGANFRDQPEYAESDGAQLNKKCFPTYSLGGLLKILEIPKV